MTRLKYQTLASADIDDTYSLDGLIVAKRASLEGGPSKIEIAHKGPVIKRA